MHKFKLGDRIRRIGPTRFGIFKGQIYTFVRMHEDNFHLYVRERLDAWQACHFEVAKPSNEERMEERRRQLCQ